ncbi:glycosyltransferase family 2 protein [Amphritea sp. 2_MG-2023]|uniref:glycosyltransferase family 2 protein n=1 Tax=Amphritea TaxID=515417 RepID=UPI001C06ECE4|nr:MULTISPECIES: glycosyltransferase family 2 protein [Amphritea]MBU2965625.1 glycosyltransferase family 2 protein [Amphritea atlantica]MDO6417181.1 glycosyltransferase family 2 protein [Amphritea sp. 2_MG-2023]
MKLAMNYLIKNEAGIILDNIKVHSKLGADCFVIIDNGSTDNTRELLDSVKDQYEMIIIDRPLLDYQQSNWKTEMAKTAAKQLGADWSIANDADEFWIPKDGNLKTEMTKGGSILACPRHNMLYDREAFDAEAPYYTQTNRVQYPIDYPKGIQCSEPHLSIMMGQIHGKVAVRSAGLLRVKGGNHRAWHAWGWLNEKQSENISVYHYPIRSKAKFIQNIENRKALLEAGITKMGDHYRRWVAIMTDGDFDQELERLVLNTDYKKVLKNIGVITEDVKACEVISHILKN